MKVFDSYELLITPLSPVHIGTGDSYEPTNYVIEDDTLYEFDTRSVLEALSQADRQELLNTVNRRPDQDMIKAVQKFFYERREPLIANAGHCVPVLDRVADLYRSRVGQTAQREAGGREIINQLVIDRTAFNPVTYRPVLSGSSLKGAIRTALLNSVNNGQSTQERKGLHDFQGRLFKYHDGRIHLERDPLRFVQVSDACWNGEADLPATEIHLAVNRKKAPVRDGQGNLRRSQAEQKGLNQFLECIPGLRYRVFSATLNIQLVNGINKETELPAQDMRFDIRRIAQACNAFYRPILQAENQLLAERNYSSESWLTTMRSLLTSDIGQILESGEAFLLRAGRHSGAESVTLEGVRTIRIMKGRNESENASSTKTVWLAAETPSQCTGMFPFGWLLVEIRPANGALRECDTLRVACDAHLESARTWAVRQREKTKEREGVATEAEARRLAEAEATRLRTEEEARAAQVETERRARLAAMTAERRATEELRQWFDEDRVRGANQSGGRLAQRVYHLLGQAPVWPAADAHVLADLAEEIFAFIGWGTSKKTRERQEQLHRLRARK